jgi:hypothetical protein
MKHLNNNCPEGILKTKQQQITGQLLPLFDLSDAETGQLIADVHEELLGDIIAEMTGGTEEPLGDAP